MTVELNIWKVIAAHLSNFIWPNTWAKHALQTEPAKKLPVNHWLVEPVRMNLPLTVGIDFIDACEARKVERELFNVGYLLTEEDVVVNQYQPKQFDIDQAFERARAYLKAAKELSIAHENAAYWNEVLLKAQRHKAEVTNAALEIPVGSVLVLDDVVFRRVECRATDRDGKGD